jgi:holliday junction DNA helicase RuvA
MIAKLTGRIDDLDALSAIVDVGGVGYLVFCSGRTLARLSVGQAASLTVETLVREDAIQLIGFADTAERDWFRLLVSVQGVGSKAALSILGGSEPSALHAAVATGDRRAFIRAPGIGPKLAARIVNELKSKVGDIAPGVTLAAGGGREGDGAAADAISALINLGFRPADAEGAIAAALGHFGSGAGVDALIRSGLAELAPREGAR